MRNLRLQYCRQLVGSIPDVKFLLLDPNVTGRSDLAYAVTSSKVHKLNLECNAVDKLAEVPDIVGAEYLALDNQICLATGAGEVLVLDPHTKALNEGTFCDVGIDCMAWSPDQEVVAFVTKTGNVVVMTCTYDPIAEHVLSDLCSGEEQFINVGWGKKETQFHGSEGKTAAKQKNEFQPAANIHELPRGIKITWRADAAYFAVSFVSDEVGRMFKVFDKEGKLNFTAEKLHDLQPAIAWRPSGTWIAMPHLLPNKSTIALFEKNGLRHREIVLPFDFSTETVVNLKWSADSDILSIETHNASKSTRHLYMYTIGNYHWYLKQVLTFKAEDPIADWCWGNRIGEEKTLHVLLKSGRCFIYRWHFLIDKLKSTGIVAVIDGNKLLLTDFAKAIVPPPMCAVELMIDAYINAIVFFTTDTNEPRLLVYDALHRLHVFEAPKDDCMEFENIGTFMYGLQLQHPPSLLSNFLVMNDEYILAAVSEGANSRVLRITTDPDDQYKLTSTLQLAGTIRSLTNGSAMLETFFVQTLEGNVQLLSMKPDNTIRVDKPYAQLEQPADSLEWFECQDLVSYGLVALGSSQCLYYNSQRVASDVTSFALTEKYLLYTKLTTLHFMRLMDKRQVSERKVERGSKLVTVIADAARTVLQMPRGNLEAICPRVLSLDIVGELLNEKKYHTAFDLLRKQRINLNIICDHNMQSFVENLSGFLQEVKNPNWLNLFLSDLQNEDFTQTMYACNYAQGDRPYPEGFKIQYKVNFLCEKLSERMEQINDAHFRLPIITAHVKIGQVQKALEIIWQQKKQESSNSNAARQAQNGAEEALKYLLYLVDVNELYNVALGTYDFGLVLFVAQKSQKDPKEYLPFLNELKKLELNYRKFKIDEFLKRYEKALHSIAACGVDKFEEALAFIKRHALYQQALPCYKEQEECYQQVCLAFADDLRANGKLEDASIMYERGGNPTQAMLSAKHVVDWQRVIYLARKYEQNVQVVALSLVASMQEHGKYEEAFQLLKNYANDFNAAFQCLLKGKLYTRAIFEARMQDEASSYYALIKADVSPYIAFLQATLLAEQELFISYKERLLAIRVRKAKQQTDGDGDFNAEIDEADLISDTTSMHSGRYSNSSRGTGKTFRSSKNRRKHERKLLSLKPGNPFEDIALIDALYNQVMKLIGQQQHISDLCKALIELQKDESGAALQKRYKQLLQLLQNSLDEIWIPELMATQQFVTGPNIDYTQLQNEQRYAMINPQKRFKPQLNIIDWEHEILKA